MSTHQSLPKTANAKKKSDILPKPAQSKSHPVVAQPKIESTRSNEEQLAQMRANREASERLGSTLITPESVPRTLPPLQPKLTIGQPGDQYEQEADRVARQVVDHINAPPKIQAKEIHQPMSVGQRKPSPLDDHPAMTVQRYATGGEMDASPDLESSIQRARGGGQPLDNGIRARMEGAFGADFSGVRVHTDGTSDQLNQSIQAKAFTTGQDVFFRSGAYEPGSRGGQELLAHELTHVVQQKGEAVQQKRDTTELSKFSGNTSSIESIQLQKERGQGNRENNARSLANKIEASSKTGNPLIQRVRIIAAKKVIYINDYHFINRLKTAQMPKSGNHDVIINDFTDFEGLAEEAAKPQNGSGKFAYQGYQWGWRGETELYPVADEKNCVSVSCEYLQQLINIAKNGGTATKDLNENKAAKKALEALNSVGKKQQLDSRGLQLPLTITINTLPKVIKFVAGSYYNKSLKNGGDKVEGFLMGPNGSKEEGPHLHIFFKCSAKQPDQEAPDRELEIFDYHCTTSQKKHLIISETGGVVDKKTGQQVTLEKNESSEVAEMSAMVEILNRSVVAGKVDKEKEKDSQNKTEEKDQILELAEYLKISREELVARFDQLDIPENEISEYAEDLESLKTLLTTE